MKTKKTRERVVFVVCARDFDINCARLTGEPSVVTKLVRFKHRARSVEVPSLLCHDTLEDAKAALRKRAQALAKSVEELEFDEDNFWVA
jgi:hypothetical protein